MDKGTFISKKEVMKRKKGINEVDGKLNVNTEKKTKEDLLAP